MLDVTLSIDESSVKNLGDAVKRLPPTLSVAMRAIVLGMVRYTIDHTLLNKNPPYLNRRTGTAIRATVASPRFTSSQTLAESDFGLESLVLTGSYGNNLGYIFRHEFGGTFTDQVRAFTRRVKNRDVVQGGRLKAEGIVITKNGIRRASQRNVYTRSAKRVALGVAQVRAHEVVRTFKARRMFRDSFAAQKANMGIPLRRSLELLLKTRRVPNVNQLKWAA